MLEEQAVRCRPPQLAVDARRTPERIRRGELADEGTHLRWYTRPAEAVSTLPGPEQAKTAPMPADDRLRLDDVKSRAPAASGPQEPRPQHPICRRQPKTCGPDLMIPSATVPFILFAPGARVGPYESHRAHRRGRMGQVGSGVSGHRYAARSLCRHQLRRRGFQAGTRRHSQARALSGSRAGRRRRANAGQRDDLGPDSGALR
jgi:hypothetical protein